MASPAERLLERRAQGEEDDEERQEDTFLFAARFLTGRDR